MLKQYAKLLSIDTNAKTVKGQKQNFLTGIVYLAPSDESAVMNTCAHASVGCRAACLFTAGRGRFDSVRQSRIDRTIFFKQDRPAFIAKLIKEIDALVRKAAKLGMTPCVRLNGTSDLPWENLGIMNVFPEVQFYDYTKNLSRMHAYCTGKMPSNYHLTFSRAEDNHASCEMVVAWGGNVAAVFSDKNLPAVYLNRPVVSGDESDLRFLDAKGVIVGLYAKGKAKKDTSGFVVHTS